MIIVYGTIKALLSNSRFDDSQSEQQAAQLAQQNSVPDFAQTLKIPIPFNHKISQIACGHSHVLILSSSQLLYSFGSNQFGQLGIPTISTQQPTLIQKISKITYISAGFYHSFALQSEGLIYAWGRGTEGQLGLCDHDCKEEPQLLSHFAPVVTIACGGSHTLFLTQDNQVFATGDNQWGQLGVPGNHAKPRFVDALANAVTEIAAGLEHSLFLTVQGQLFVSGNNLFGQCGKDGGVSCIKTPTQLQLKRIQHIFAPLGTFSLVITEDSEVWIWGTGSWGYCRRPTLLTEVCCLQNLPAPKLKELIVGDNYALTIAEEGEVHLLGTSKLPEFNSHFQKLQCDKLDIEIEDKGLIACGNRFVVAVSQSEDIQQHCNCCKERMKDVQNLQNEVDIYKRLCEEKENQIIELQRQLASMQINLTIGQKKQKVRKSYKEKFHKQIIIPETNYEEKRNATPTIIEKAEKAQSVEKASTVEKVAQKELSHQLQHSHSKQETLPNNNGSNRIDSSLVKLMTMQDILNLNEHNIQKAEVKQNMNKSRGLIQSIDAILTQFRSTNKENMQTGPIVSLAANQGMATTIIPTQNGNSKHQITKLDVKEVNNNMIQTYFQRIEQLQQNITKSKNELRKSLEANKVMMQSQIEELKKLPVENQHHRQNTRICKSVERQNRQKQEFNYKRNYMFEHQTSQKKQPKLPYEEYLKRKQTLGSFREDKEY